MAKGVEDTAFYRWLRLTALNEVGGNPDRFSLSPDDFHRAALERLERHPHTLLASQTHDTKRAGDVRARIGALAALHEEWAERVRRWHALTGGMDDPNEEYLLWQTLVGAWPIVPGRLELYLEKALREAKRTTNWLEPDEAHEQRVKDFVRDLYSNQEFLDDFEPFAVARRAGRRARVARRAAPPPDEPRPAGHLPGRRAPVAQPRRPRQPPAGRLGRRTPPCSASRRRLTGR